MEAALTQMPGAQFTHPDGRYAGRPSLRLRRKEGEEGNFS